MMDRYFSSLPEDCSVPNILVVGCGRVGESIVRTFVNYAPHGAFQVYVTDSDKERARKLSEYRLSVITPIRWRSAHDTPEDVDVIVIAVDHDSEHKIIDRLALSKKPFISLSDDAGVFEEYEEYEDEFRQAGVQGIIGTGLVPGASNVLVRHCAKNFDSVYDVIVERLGFVSSSSLASVKSARRDAPLSIRDGIATDSRRKAGSSLSWFPPPYNLVHCQSVASGVTTLARTYPSSHNISVRFAEPKLPTFTERIRNVFFQVPLTTTRACIRAEVHGMKNGQIGTHTEAITGDAMTIITHTSVMSIMGLHNNSAIETQSPFINCDDVVTPGQLLNSLYSAGVTISRFDGIE
ncbi:MAG TPA: NAD(P)-binding domain-containing protein [Acidimicrobiia bacterium]|nr:NAD(P)-binding domain-containing protein [Acidimicrobiia bacterium]